MLSRFLLLGLLAFAPLSGCLDDQSSRPAGAQENPDQSDPSDPEMGGADIQCEIAADCALAASTCCDCPSFAVPLGEGYGAGCEEVDCGASGLCPAVEASCDDGQCVMICSPLIADKVCSFGFAMDAAGCLVNECEGEPASTPTECEVDADCVQVPADCCGCGLGGADKALPAGQAEDDANELNCPIDPACPGIDVCDADESAQCISGQCTLAATPGSLQPPDAADMQCGTPDLPACATGFSCVLNAVSANDATALGVGTCVEN